MSIFNKNDPIIVVGAGVMGLSTVYSLLQQGYTNIDLFDKNDYLKQEYSFFKGCDSPSSDLNKIFRTAYGGETHYQEMANVAQRQFLKWNEQIFAENWEGGVPIYYNTGFLNITDKNELPAFEKQSLKNLGQNSIDISQKDAYRQAASRGLFSTAIDPFNVQKNGKLVNGVLDTTGGMVLAEKACRWVLELCMRLNTENQLKLHFGTEEGLLYKLLIEWNPNNQSKKCVGIITKGGFKHFSPLVIVACGPWIPQIVPEANEKMEATAGTVVLVKIDDKVAAEKYAMSKFPTWSFNAREGAFGNVYGFPITNGYMKLGFRGMKFINPKGQVNSVVKTKWSEENDPNVPLFGLNIIKNFIREYIPEITKITMTRMCWYGDSEDNNYVISYCPYYTDNSLFVMGGDSGHAFKMLGILGDYVLDVLKNKGNTKLAHLWSWERERQKLNQINLGENDPRALCHNKMSTFKDWTINPLSKL
ncbi:hypothetical protein DAMA08_021520 [Martiniozyma asiatica (nom. inval.)]|nr:hypothetical protein DAMA08_021520 [Martiniozyma asiatica]